MKATVETIREIVKVLTTEEQQLLKDTFLFGAWGDTETEFLDEEGKVEIGGLHRHRRGCRNVHKLYWFSLEIVGIYS